MTVGQHGPPTQPHLSHARLLPCRMWPLTPTDARKGQQPPASTSLPTRCNPRATPPPQPRPGLRASVRRHLPPPTKPPSSPLVQQRLAVGIVKVLWQLLAPAAARLLLHLCTAAAKEAHTQRSTARPRVTSSSTTTWRNYAHGRSSCTARSQSSGGRDNDGATCLPRPLRWPWSCAVPGRRTGGTQAAGGRLPPIGCMRAGASRWTDRAPATSASGRGGPAPPRCQPHQRSGARWWWMRPAFSANPVHERVANGRTKSSVRGGT